MTSADMGSADMVWERLASTRGRSATAVFGTARLASAVRAQKPPLDPSTLLCTKEMRPLESVRFYFVEPEHADGSGAINKRPACRTAMIFEIYLPAYRWTQAREKRFSFPAIARGTP
jgi:hypothetical protein